MNGQPFNRATAEHRLGPAAVAAIARIVEAAPPLRAEQRMQLQAVFNSARSAPVQAPPRAA